MISSSNNRTGRQFSSRPVRLIIVALVVCSLGTALAFAASSIITDQRAHASRLTVKVRPAANTVAQGDSIRVHVFVADGRSHSLRLSGRTHLKIVGRLPPGTSAAFSPRPSAGRAHSRRAALTVTTTARTPPGAYALRVHASRPHRTGTAMIRLLVVTKAATPDASPPAPPPLNPPAPPPAFTIDGSLSSFLTPGSGEELDLILTNLQDSDLRISALTLRVAIAAAPESTSTRRCAPIDFAVTPFSGAPGFILPASSTKSLSDLGFAPADWPRVSMVDRDVNQDGCKLASLDLLFAGTATSAAP